MATHQQTTTETYRCPNCNDVLTLTAGTWSCADCRHAPRHGAD
jgi:ribosomal protein L37AE/L43A